MAGYRYCENCSIILGSRNITTCWSCAELKRIVGIAVVDRECQPKPTTHSANLKIVSWDKGGNCDFMGCCQPPEYMVETIGGSVPHIVNGQGRIACKVHTILILCVAMMPPKCIKCCYRPQDTHKVSNVCYECQEP